MKRRFLFLLPAVIFSLLSCTPLSQYQQDDRPKTLVEVHNRGWNMVKVYLARNGITIQQLGEVESSTTQRFYVYDQDLERNEFLLVEFVTGQKLLLDEIPGIPDGSYVRLDVENLFSTSSFSIFPIKH